jgi:filamentous hemagglutinin family protein
MVTYKRLTRQITAYISIALMISQPVIAAGIVVDGKADSANQAEVTSTSQGVPLVNITAPSSSGLSHNKFDEYSVDENNLILNNATSSVDTVISGQIDANPNFNGPSATLILNEVTGSSQSTLNGYTEIAGDEAELIVANPNGITCSGCGFINTPRATLTTGTPILSNGQLQSFSVNGGNISIAGDGLNAGNVDQLDLISRSLEVDAPLLARELNLITGLNDVTFQDLRVTVRENSKDGTPLFAIDASSLGGMYVNQIQLIATEQGVGVSLDGSMATDTGDVTLSADGSISLNNVVAEQNVAIESVSGDVSVSQLIYGEGVDISAAENAINTGTIASLNDLSITASDVNNIGYVVGGLKDDSTLNANQSVTIDADTVTNTGSVFATEDLNVSSDSIANQNGTMEAISGDLNLNVSGSIDNENAQMVAGNNINLTTDNFVGTEEHGFNAGNSLVVNANNFSNSFEFETDSNLELNLANNFSNEGSVEATGNITVTAAAADNQATGTIAASGATNIEASGDVTNLGSVTGGTGVELSGENILNKGVVASGGTLTVTAVNDFINSNADENDYPISLYDSNDEGYIPIGGEKGTILFSVADMSIYSDNFLNQYAEVYTFSDLTIAEDSSLNSATNFLNSSSTVQAYGDIDIYADEVKNYRDPIVDIDVSAIQDMCSSFGDDIPEFCIRTIIGGDDYGIPSGTQLSEAWLYSELASLWYVGDEFSQQDYEIAQDMLEQLYLAALYTPTIQSGSDISISGTDVVNSAGVISAENNIEINSSNFTNESVAAVTPGSSYSDERYWYYRSYYLGPLFNMDTVYYKQENGTWIESNYIDLLDDLWFGDLDPFTDNYVDLLDDPDSDYSVPYEPLQYILLNASSEFIWDVDDVASIVILSDGTVNVRSQDISANLLIDENNDVSLLVGASDWDDPYIVEDEDYDTTEEILSYVSTYISFNDEAGYYELTLGSEIYPMVPGEDSILVAQFNPDNMPVEFKVQDAIEGYTTTAESNVVYPNDWSQESAIVNTTFLPGEIQAGGNLTINATNSFTNGLDVEGVYQELDTPNVSVPTVDVDSNTSNTESASLDLEDNSDTFDDLYNSEPTSDDFDYEVVEVDTSIPDSCGLFCETEDGEEYLVATNASVSQFIESYGSDYLLEQLNYEPEADVKRLGDSFYESYLISDAIMSQTGSRFISSDLHSDASQMKYLMDNAIAAQESMQLSIGVRLTDSQVAALTHDMMWLEEQEIDGQTVLVPVLYLAQVTENDISPSGGIVGRSVEINTDLFKNTGSIVSESFVSLDVESELKNNGKIISGSDTQIQAGNITNNSTISSGGDLTVDTGSLKLNENSTLSATGSADIEASSVLLNSSNLYVGGSLDLTADYSVAVQDSVITSGSSVAIEASAGDLSFANTTLDTGNDLSLSSGNDFSNDSTMSVAGDLNVTARNISNTGEMAAGENLNLTAQDDITNTAATLTAGEDMNLNAGGDVVFDYSTTPVTTKETPEKTTGIFGLTLSAQEKTTTEEIVTGTTVSVGNNLNINAGENIDVTASDINAGGSATLIAEKDITLDAVSTESKTGTSKDYQTSLVYTGSSIGAGDDLTLSAGEDLTVMSSDVSAAGDVILAADSDVEIGAYQNEYYSYYYKKKSGWFSSKTTIKETFDTENVASTIAAGGNLTVNSAIADDGSILTGNDSGSVNVSGSTLTAGEQMVVYGDDVSVTNQKEIDYDYSKTKKSSWFGLSKSSDTDTKYQEMIAQSKLESEEDMSLLSSGGVKVIGSDVVSGGDLNIVASGDVEIVAAQAVSTQESSHSDSSFSIDPTKIYEANEDYSFTSETTTTASSLTSEGDINLDASRITFAGSNATAENDINATADVGDIEVISVEEAHVNDSYEEHLELGITNVGEMVGQVIESIKDDQKISVSLLQGKFSSGEADVDSTTVASSTLTANNDINLDAVGDVEIIGSDLTSDADGTYEGDINLTAGDDIVIAESYETEIAEYTEVEGEVDLSVTVSNQYVEAVKAADDLLAAEEQLEDVNEDYRQYQKDLEQLEDRLVEMQDQYDAGVPGISYEIIAELDTLIDSLESDEAIYKAAITAASADVVSKTTLLAQKTAAAAQSTGTYGIDVGLTLDISGSETNTSTASSTAVGSTLSGTNINLNTDTENNAEGDSDSVTVQGSDIYAAGNVNINTDELNVTASESTYSSTTETEEMSASVSMSVYGASTGPSANASVSGSESE